MSLSLIPIFFLVVVAVTSQPIRHDSKHEPVPSKVIVRRTPSPSRTPEKTVKPLPKQSIEKFSPPTVTDQIRSFDSEKADLEKERAAIKTYISSVYKSVSEEDADEISDYLIEFGKKNNMDPKLAAALIARESSFNKNAVSATGAKGLGQIKGFNYDSLDIEDPFDIRQNVSGTVSYLNEMVSKWKVHDKESDAVSLGIASYFKGYTAVKKDRNNTGGVDTKTKNYVDDILSTYQKLVQLRDTLPEK